MRRLLVLILALAACGGPRAVDTIQVTVGTLVLRVEVANTPAERRTGLMERTEVPHGTGMLFLYPRTARWGGFWMKRTLVPLDIAFIAGGRIVHIATMQPCADGEECPLTTSGEAYDAALEVAAGTFAREGIDVGTAVTLHGPRPRSEAFVSR